MKATDIKNKILWGICSIGCLGFSYWLCRFAFFGIHGMKQWPNALAVVGLVIVVIASIVGKRKLSIATVAGYIGGFIIAMIFNTDGLDPGGGRTNNAWIIWGCVFILSVIIGLFIENKGRIVGFISTLIVICGLTVFVLVQIFKDFSVVTILIPVIVILALASILGYVRKKSESMKKG